MRQTFRSREPLTGGRPVARLVFEEAHVNGFGACAAEHEFKPAGTHNADGHVFANSKDHAGKSIFRVEPRIPTQRRMNAVHYDTLH